MVKGNAKILNIVKFFATILLVIAMAIVMVLQSITNNYAKVSSKHQYTSNISNATEVELETVEDLSVEVIPQRGVNILESNDVVYEGEYIKYNIKVTNNTEQEMNNINIIGEIPDGVKLAELYYNFDEIRQPYGYTFSDEKQINIEIDSLEAGKTKELFYEVKVCDLEDDIESLQITSIINTYLNNEIKNTFELENEIKPAEVKLFLGSYVENGARTYVLNLASEIQSQVEVNFYLPQEYSVTTICMVDISDFDVTKAYNGGGRYVYIEGEDNQNTDYTLDISISEENVLTTTLESNHTYKFVGPMDSLQIERDADEIEKTITAYVETADGKYVSNENRMNIYLQSVEVTMSSPNERSLLKYQEELEYDVEIKNIGSDLIEYREINNYVVVNVSDFLPDEINANEIIYDNWKILYDEINVDDEVVRKEVGIEKIQVIEDISGNLKNEDDEKLANVDIQLIIPEGETVRLKIKGTAGMVYEKTQVENIVKVTSREIKDTLSNKVALTILPYDYEDIEETDEPTTPDEPTIPDEPTTPDNIKEPTEQGTPDKSNVSENNKKPVYIEDVNKNKKCDLKIDKTVSKITVSTINGTKNYDYSNEKLAKVEIRSKEIAGATVIIEYKIVVENIGEIAASIDGIKDYLPSGLTFSAELNKNWILKTDGTLFYTCNSDYIMQPGEVLNLKLVATKQMKSNTAGTFTNKVELQNVKATGNKNDNNMQNNTSNAEVIIGVSTGAYTYVAISFIILAVLIIVAIALYRKGILNVKKIKRTTFLSIFIIVILFGQVANAAWWETNVVFYSDWNGDLNSICYTWSGGPGGLGGECMEGDLGDEYALDITLWGDNYGFPYIFTSSFIIPGGHKDDCISSTDNSRLDKLNDNINVEKNSNEYWYGPFEYYANEVNNDSLRCKIFDKLGTEIISGWKIFDKDKLELEGVNKLGVSGQQKFYIVFDESTLENGISRISLTGSGKITEKRRIQDTYQAEYIGNLPQIIYDLDPYYYELYFGSDPNYLQLFIQRVRTLIPASRDYDNVKYVDRSIEWSGFKSSLEVTKNDANDKNTVLPNVEFKIKHKATGNYLKEDDNGNISYVSKENASIFKTDENGKFNISNIESGTYAIEEISNPYYGYTELISQDVKIASGECANMEITNEKQLGNMDIFKKDTFSGKGLPGISLKIKASNGQWIVAVDENGEVNKVTGDISVVELKYTNDENSATEFITDDTGHVRINDIVKDNYIIEEINNPHYGYTELVSKEVSMSGNQNLTVEIENLKHTGNISLIKKDPDNKKTLQGVGFKLKASNGQWIIAVDSQGAQSRVTGEVLFVDQMYTNNKDEATEFITDSEGNVKINDIMTDTYLVEEVSIGQNTYYEIDDNYITWSNSSGENGEGNTAKISVELQGTTDVSTIIYNRQKYVDVSGNVWEDKISGKDSNRNNMYKDNEYDTEDKEVANVTVRLVEVVTEDGNNPKIIDVQNPVVTDENGRYSFEMLEIDKLNDYYVIFTYNGMSYEAIELDRQKINDLSITNINRAEEASLRDSFNDRFTTIENNLALNVNKDKEVDMLYDGPTDNKSTLMYNEDPSKYIYGYEGANFPINGVDDKYLISSKTYETLGNIQSPKSIREVGITEVTGINLGVYEREHPDLFVINDINNVELSIKGYNHTYLYGKRFEHRNEMASDASVEGIGVKFGEKYTKSYSQPIYRADAEYKSAAEDNLNVYIEYEIGLINQSTGLTSKVNSIVDYYDIQYNIVEIAVGHKETIEGKEVDIKENLLKNETDYKESNYDDSFKKVDVNKLDITLEPGDEKIVYIKFQLTNDKILNIINNVPVNCIFNNVAEITSYSTTKDGEVYAGVDKNSNPGNAIPGKEETYENDTDDAPDFNLKEAEPRTTQGTVFFDNPILNEGEKAEDTHTGNERIGNGIFDNGEQTIDGVKVLLKEGGKTVAEDITENGGNYVFNGYTPGKYTIEFVWGNGAETSGGIQINPYDFKGTIYEESRLEQKDIWHKIDVDTRKNDAMDDMDIRGKLDDFSVNENGGIDYNVFENSRTADDIMISKTPIMNIEIEYTNDSDQISSYIIKNVDFGIIERPRQYLQLQKQLSKVDLVLQNGQLLVTSVRLPDGSMSSPEGVTYQGPSSYSNPPNGFLNIAIDSELLQGSTLNVEYTLQVKNMSEKDYTTENYYLYGIRSEDEMVVTLTPTILVDYLDNDFAFNESDNDKWEKIDLNDLRNKVSNTVCDADGIKDKRIIKTTSLNDKPLGPGYSSDIVTLKTKKLLSSKSVIELNNESEIIELKTTGTRLTTTIPGNYVPGMMFETNGINEPDDDMAEGLTITPPTGKVINESLYMISTLLGIIIVGIGAITIKKKVL